MITAALAALALATPSMDEREELLRLARAAAADAIPLAEKDLNRPAYHFRAPARWMNDPNGPIYYKGWYHLFYQFNPYGDQWGNMHWGHARSKDLVDWEHLPIALWPTRSKGEQHIFSGSTFFDAGGKPIIFYTSIGHPQPEQWIATPADDQLIEWFKPSANPVLTPATHAPTNIEEWRDPFLFTEGGLTYMLVGGRHEGKGAVALYCSENPDLTRWKFEGILFHHATSNLIECPNIVKFGSKWVLLASHDGRVDWFVGELDLKSKKFYARRTGVLAEGSYASQLLRDPNGNTIHLAWVHTADRTGWNGFLTLPSILSLSKAGDLVRSPVAALVKLRNGSVSVKPREINRELDLFQYLQGNRVELILHLQKRTADKIELDIAGRTLVIDFTEAKLNVPGRTPIPIKPTAIKLHLFQDRSALDVYVDDGASSACITGKDFKAERLRLRPMSGTVRISKLEIHRLRAAEFEPYKK